LIKINLVREGRTVRGAGAAPAAAAAASGGGPSNLNNILIVAGLVVGGLIAGGWWFVENNKLKERKATVDAKKQTAQRLEAIIKEVDDYTKRKESLQKRIDLINQLKQNQKGPVKVMDRVSQDLPDLVWLDRMKISGGMVTISGRALNPNAVANFVDNVKNDPLFEEPELQHLTEVSVIPLVYGFDITFHYNVVPKAEAGATGTTGATGTGASTGTGGTTTRTGTR
jgi:Tfp pilus assembly protein PilN